MEVGWWGGHGHSCVDDRGDGGVALSLIFINTTMTKVVG